MNDLIADLERATEGSRELSDGVLVALGRITPAEADVPEAWEARDHPTCDMTAALDLVPDGWAVDMARCPEMASAVRVYFGPIRENSAGEPIGRGHTLPLALCAAILRARGDDHG